MIALTITFLVSAAAGYQVGNKTKRPKVEVIRLSTVPDVLKGAR